MILDKSNFLASGYQTQTSEGALGLQSEPLSSKKMIQSSQDSSESQQKRKTTLAYDDFKGLSDKEDEEDEDFDDEEDDEKNEDFDDDSGLDSSPTPTSRLPSDSPKSSASSMPPPAAQTSKSSAPCSRPKKKRKSEFITSILKQLPDMQKVQLESLNQMQMQTLLVQQKTEIVLAEMRAQQAEDRLANMEMHKMYQQSMQQWMQWMQEETKAKREIIALLLDKTRIKPLATLSPAFASPPSLLQVQPSGFNIDSASSLPMIENVVPPLPLESPILTPLLPLEEIVLEASLDVELQKAIKE